MSALNTGNSYSLSFIYLIRSALRVKVDSNVRGRVVSWASTGTSGFKGPRRGTPYVAQAAAVNAIRTVVDQGMQRAGVMIKGPGLGRDAALRAICRSGILFRAKLNKGERNILVGNGNKVPVEVAGTLSLVLESGFKLNLFDTVYVPSITRNLISVFRLVAYGYSILFENKAYGNPKKYTREFISSRRAKEVKIESSMMSALNAGHGLCVFEPYEDYQPNSAMTVASLRVSGHNLGKTTAVDCYLE
ncbi:hypothetical protein ZIOFF_072458 [Zingiber officinale]|uniref:Retrovirus-related Pol polyprotein from transposon TNT 1-94-like beta-barrel domain-containing protein n=1 Tax=Zingiber officinale TaxID=94328 RepID=A0A8J5ES86_ZINOF|nr:hypothetical protein ZIOFF_072458 [Zingiber officinale]